MKLITWEEIANEVQNHESYKAAYVAIFRKYEGQETDKRDCSNRVVKVTAASFARYFKIDERTFQRWVNPPAKPEVGVILTPTSEPEPTVEQPEPQVRPAPQRTPSERPQPEVPVEWPEKVHEPVQPLGRIKAVMDFGDHVMKAGQAVLAMIEIVQAFPAEEHGLTALYEASIEEMEDDLNALKSVVRSKSITIEDFMKG